MHACLCSPPFGLTKHNLATVAVGRTRMCAFVPPPLWADQLQSRRPRRYHHEACARVHIRVSPLAV